MNLDEIAGYKIINEIGRGAKGIAYRAEKGGKSFAIKILSMDSKKVADLDEATRFRQEAVALARISCSSIVKVFDVGEDKGIPFIVMELIGGGSLAEHLKKGKVEANLPKKVLYSVAQALAEIHRLRLVHRDIKLDNILLTEAHEAKLIDLGLVKEANRDSEVPTEIVGTLIYASLEQSGILKRPVDGRSDLYSLGISLFELCTGAPPFVSEDVAALLQMHATVLPPLVSEINPAISPVLARIIAKLLEKDPDDRYQSAKGLIKDLDRIEELEKQFQTNAKVLLGQFDNFAGAAEIPMVGRKNELEKLVNCWRNTLRSRGGIAIIEGEGGSGKSRLAAELLSRSSKDNAVVLRGKCSSVDSLAFSVVRDALGAYFSSIALMSEKEKENKVKLLSQINPHILRAVSRLAPGIRSLFNLGKEEWTGDQEAFFEQLIEFFQEFAKLNSNVILFLDDIQWIDEASGRFLKKLSSHIVKSQVLVVCTARNDNDSKEALTNFKNSNADAIKENIALEPLTMAETSEMISVYLGGHVMADSTVDRIATAANHNPFAISEIVNAMLNAGIIFFGNGAWSVEESRLSEISVSNDIYKLILNRIANLDSEKKMVLSLAAVSGNRFNSVLLQRASRRAESLVLDAIQHAIDLNLIEPIDAQRYAFVHDRVREALVSHLTTEELKAAHDSIAACLEEISDRTPEMEHELANHYLRGNLERNEVLASQAFVRAGQAAVVSYAYKTAYEFLDAAFEIIKKMPVDLKSKLVLVAAEPFVIACQNLAHLDQAHTILDFAFQFAKSPIEKGKLLYLKMTTFTSQARIRDGWSTFLQAQKILNKPYPTSILGKIFAIFKFLPLMIIQSKTKWGYGSLNEPSKAEEKEIIKLIAMMSENALLNAFFRIDILDLVLIGFRQTCIVFRLGTSKELAVSLTNNSILWSALLMPKLVERDLSTALKMSRELGDFGLEVYVQAYACISRLFVSGDFDAFRESSMKLIPIGPKYLNGWARAQLFTTMVLANGLQGHSREAVELAERLIGLIDETKNWGLMGTYRIIFSTNLAVMGRAPESLQYLNEAKSSLSHVPRGEDPYDNATVPFNVLYAMLEVQDIWSEKIEETIKEFYSYGPRDFLFVLAPVVIAQIRIQQYDLSPTDSPKRSYYRAQLKKAILDLTFKAMVPVFKAHLCVAKAALARIDQRFDKAEKFLEKAEKLNKVANSVMVQYWIFRERARLSRACGNNKYRIEAEAKAAWLLAQENGWRPRMKELEAEFKIKVETPQASGGVSKTTTIMSGTSGSLNSQRAVNAILEISLASAKSVDSIVQARSMLDSLIRVMGAERACIFLVNNSDSKKELTYFVGREASGKELDQIAGYSTTVVNKTFSEKKPIVVTGSEQGAVSASQSVVAYNLRSIMAVPLKLREDLKGVLYMDSTLAKGLFTEDDLGLLSTIANQISVAVESSRMASIEASRRAMEKDLEISATVQRFFLPSSATLENSKLSLSAFYRPASQCGGDWWWYKMRSENKLVCIVADVTGHGAGPAMITTAVATYFKAVESGSPSPSLKELITRVSSELYQIAKGEYLMTLFAMEIDMNTLQVEYCSAGHPNPFILKPDGKSEGIGAVGSHMGVAPSDFSLDVGQYQLSPKDRILIYTDGILEAMNPEGLPYGERLFLRTMKKLSNLSPKQAALKLIEGVDQHSGSAPQDDDYTFVVIDVV